MKAVNPAGTCVWTFHAGQPGYWTVVDNCTSGSCVGSATSGFTKSSAAGQTEYKALKDDFEKAVKAKFAGSKKIPTKDEVRDIAKLANPQDQDTFTMDCT